MDLGIAGKVALVTASSGGMGRNIAHALAAEGANVVLLARSAAACRDYKTRSEPRDGVSDFRYV